MIRGLLRLGLLGLGASWLVDRWLANRPGADGLRVPIVSEVDIDAPIDVVWDAIADIERQPEWMHDLKTVTVLTRPPLGVGTRAIGTVRILGISVEDPIAITEFDRPSHYAIAHEGLFKGSGVIKLTDATDRGQGRPARTHVRWTEILVPPVFPHLGALIQRPILGAVFQADLEHLRDLVESGGTRAVADSGA